MSRGRTLLVVIVAGLVAIVALTVALAGGDDDSFELGPVERSDIDGFPTRGELAGDQGLLDAAAEAWQSSERVADGEFEALVSTPQALWAGSVPGRFEDRTERLVLLYDPSTFNVAAVYFGADEEEGSLADVEERGEAAFSIALDGGPLLTAANLPTLEVIEADDNRGLTLETATLDPKDGLLADPYGEVVIPASADPSDAADAAGQVPILLVSGDFVASRETWPTLRRLLLDRIQSPAVVAAIEASGETGDEGSLTSGATLVTPLFDGLLPGGRPGVVMASGVGAAASAGLAYFERDGDEGNLSPSLRLAEGGASDPVGLGEAEDAPQPILVAQVVSPGAPDERFLLVAGDREIERLRIEFGGEAVEMAGSTAVLDRTELPGLARLELDPVVVTGFTAQGEAISAR